MSLKCFVRIGLLVQFGMLNTYAASPLMKISVVADRGSDQGQSFGSLFQVESTDGSIQIGAGFQNAYNTRYRADRHAVQLYLRSTVDDRSLEHKALPRPNDLCGTYLYGRDDVVYSTYGGLRSWNPTSAAWDDRPTFGGTDEAMRLGSDVLYFGDSQVKCNDRLILDRPEVGSYELFFYANGHLCFYHVNRRGGKYRHFVNDDDGFSKLVACPWTPSQSEVDLSKAVQLTLPIVGETTFAWGQLGKQIITGSNIGGFYVFADNRWSALLQPDLKVSYQLYSTMAFENVLLMGQYPTGRLFQYDGKEIQDIAGWPPLLDGVSPSAREAQTTAIYGGELFVGVWPWGELWRYHPGQKQWEFARRMFDHPDPSNDVTHPYDVQNRSNPISNLWGQRITSLVTTGPSLFVSTSAKTPCVWDADSNPFLSPNKWKSYGTVYQLTMPGHLGAATAWTDGPTKFEFAINRDTLTIHQDGKLIGTAAMPEMSTSQLETLSALKTVRWGKGIYGDYGGKSVSGSVATE